MNEIKFIIDKFETSIKHSIIPTTSFMLFLLTFDILFYENKIIAFLDKEHSYLTFSLLFIAFLGLANLLSTLNQALYDNSLKGNFNGLFPWQKENNKLDNLRSDVLNRLNIGKENDYMLYKKIAKDMDTTAYTTQAKTFGIMFISLMVVTSIWFYFYFHQEGNLSILSQLIILIATIGIEYYIGRELVKSRYRSRAIKIYTNFTQEENNANS